MRLRLFAALAVLMLPAASPVLAQAEAFDDNAGPCHDIYVGDECLPEERARVRELLGVRSIEDEAASGAVVYRAFFVNGYGRDMPAIAFERRPGQSPEVVVYGREGRSTAAPVSADAWRRIQSEARLADRQLAPPPPRPDQSVVICSHGWVQTVEIANAPRERMIEEPVRQRTESACGDSGPTTAFAFLLADLAVQQIPWCESLDGPSRNNVTRLATCLIFSGDRMAAAELHNARLADDDWQYADDLNVRDLHARLGVYTAPVLTWGDQVIRADNWMDDTIPAFLLARFADHHNLHFRPTSVEGVNPHRVVVRGTAGYAGADDVHMSAGYSQTWVWNLSSLNWAIAEWSVEAFTPVSTDQ